MFPLLPSSSTVTVCPASTAVPFCFTITAGSPGFSSFMTTVSSTSSPFVVSFPLTLLISGCTLSILNVYVVSSDMFPAASSARTFRVFAPSAKSDTFML